MTFRSIVIAYLEDGSSYRNLSIEKRIWNTLNSATSNGLHVCTVLIARVHVSVALQEQLRQQRSCSACDSFQIFETFLTKQSLD